MAADIKVKYPATITNIAVTLLHSLASSSDGLSGWVATAISNTTNEDIDHLVSGVIYAGTSPSGTGQIKVYAATPYNGSVFPGSMSTAASENAASMFTSQGALNASTRLIWSADVDGGSDSQYCIPSISIKDVFGEMPPSWTLYVTQDTGVALKSFGNSLGYQRVRKQTT